MPKETTRKCIVSGKVKEKSQMLRFVMTPDNKVVPDLYKKLGGKGVYVSIGKNILKKAIAADLFSKAFKHKVKIENILVEQVEKILYKQALNSISLARRDGTLITGMDKIVEACKKNKVEFFLEAEDAASDGHKKILAYAKDLKVFNLFKIEELDKELAKDSTVHLAFVKGNMAKMVEEELTKLTSFLNN